jgi:hypothetical protein
MASRQTVQANRQAGGAEKATSYSCGGTTWQRRGAGVKGKGRHSAAEGSSGGLQRTGASLTETARGRRCCQTGEPCARFRVRLCVRRAVQRAVQRAAPKSRWSRRAPARAVAPAQAAGHEHCSSSRSSSDTRIPAHVSSKHRATSCRRPVPLPRLAAHALFVTPCRSAPLTGVKP